MFPSVVSGLDTKTRLCNRQLEADDSRIEIKICQLLIYNISHTLFTVQSGAEVLDLVQPDGGDSMVVPGLLHLPLLHPVLPSPLVYLISVIGGETICP